jgi:hypothetical protein
MRIMNATVELVDSRQYLNLLHALFAIHDRSTEDVNTITFRRDDGFTLHIKFSFNFVSFGRDGEPEENRFWTENISIGEMDDLLGMFIGNCDEMLRRFRWLARPTASRRRKRK